MQNANEKLTNMDLTIQGNVESSGPCRYHVEIDMNSNSTHATVVRLIGGGKRVLELGCATGHMSRVLRDRECKIVAIEMDAQSAERASAFCERVIIGDLDHLNLDRELGVEQFDVIVAADVLEHLKDPASVLRAVKRFLKPEGYAVVSLPNVAHLSVRLAVLAGRFPYAETGLLDRTHLRFFTRESVEKLFDDAGFAIGHFQGMPHIPPDPARFEVPYDPAAVPPPLLEALSRDPETWTYQFAVVAYPLPQAGLTFIQSRFKQLAREVQSIRKDASDLQQQLEKADHVNETSRVEVARLRAEVERVAQEAAVANSAKAELQKRFDALSQESATHREDAARQNRLRVEAEGRLMVLRGEAARAERRIVELAAANASSEQEASELRKNFEDQTQGLARLTAQAEILSIREKDLRKMLLDANDHLLGRDEEIAALRGAANSAKAELQERVDALNRESATYREDAARLHRLKVEAEGRLLVVRGEAAQAERRIAELAAANASSEQEASELRKNFEDQTQGLARLTAQNQILSIREKDLREMLLEAHDQLLRRDDEITAMLGTSHSPVPALGKYGVYQQLVQRIRDVVHQSLPEGSKVVVISKGDDQLLKLDPCRGLHFPQQEDGIYAGHYPPNDEAAIKHLNSLRQAGARYLLIPHTALWWLDHYRAFRDHLNQHHTRVVDQPETCVIFDLGNQNKSQPAREERPHAASPEHREFGVNIAGHIRSEKGVGEGARSTIRSLKAAGVPVALNDFTDFSSLNTDTEFTSASDANPYAINLIHANADCIIEFMQWKTGKYFEGHYNIGFWAWELSRFPHMWSSGFNPLDEVWVPSTFVLDSISRASPVPVVAVPHSLRKLTIAGDRDRTSFGLPRDKFLFLFMFDFMSILERKNPLGMIEAFKRAFKPRDKAMLLLKFSHAEDYPAEWRALERAAKGASIMLINQVLSREDTDSLLTLCDCYVSLHRSEGFGLSMAEAMSLAKPVIATGYSGNMDFMTPMNSFLVKYRLVPLDQDYPPYPKGSVWADPDQDHAVELMRSVFENRKLAREVGRQAQKDVRANLGDAAVGLIIRGRLATLGALGKLSVPDQFLNAPEPLTPKRRKPEYQRLVGQMQKLIRSATAPGATVMVISKGDEEMVKLPGRQGWHFPRQEDGAYAGYYPSDSAAAIGHLEVLRAKGGEFLLIPGTALWWLDHYAEFRQYLDNCYRRVKADKTGALYELSKPRTRLRAGILRAQERPKRKVNGAVHPDLPLTSA